MSAPNIHANLHAVVPAAGSGVRLGSGAEGIPKQYQQLLGIPVLQRTVARLQGHPLIRSVTVAIARDDQRFAQLEFADKTPVLSVTGGATRAESVLSALEQLLEAGEADWVLVHDAARPCLSRKLLDRLLEQGLQHADGAILALPVSDTLKRQAGDGVAVIEETVDRSGLWAAQTPQLFPLQRLADALRELQASGSDPTDEAGAMEAQGARPLLVRGDATNLKVTWPGDLQVAEALLKNQSDGEESFP